MRQKRTYNFTLNLGKLRSSVSKESHRLWVKARKKFTLENNKPLGRKDIVNTMREWMFAIQLAETGTIYDFTVANELKTEVNSETEEHWEYYEKKYK